MGHGTKVVLASNDQLAETIGQMDSRARLLTAVLCRLKKQRPAFDSGFGRGKRFQRRDDFVNNLLGSDLVSVSSSTQVLSLLSNAVPVPEER